MEMQGSRTLAVTVQQAWEALNDPAILRECIPGCERFEATEPGAYAVAAAIKIGPVAARFGGRVQLSDIVPMASYTLSFEAQGGPAGFGQGQAAVRLTPTAEGCELGYTVRSTVGGKLAQLGQRLMDGASRALADDFFRRFEEALSQRYPAATPAAGASDLPSASSSPDRLAGTGLRPWVWAVAAVVVAGLVFIATRG